MQKLLVLSIFLLSFIFVSINSYADESQLESINKEQLIQEKMVAVRHSTMCQVLYYNFALYFIITDTIAKDFNIPEEDREAFMKVYESSKNKYELFYNHSQVLVAETVELGVPFPVVRQAEMLGSRMAVDSITSLTRTLIQDPSYGDKFFDTLLELSNLCDAQIDENK